MSEPVAPQAPPDPDAPAGFAARFALYQRAGGVITPLLTTVIAFLIGGLVVLLVAGKNPLSTYKQIFNGTGLNWLWPWNEAQSVGVTQPCSIRQITSSDPTVQFCASALSLQQTLIQLTVLILTALAVAFAFRCGLFNIGGQGQYIMGLIAAVQVGIWFDSLPAFLHIILAAAAATLAGALWAGIAGILKATVGAHEVITTIMLNWTAIFVGVYLIQGPLFDQFAKESGAPPITKPISEGAKLPVIWGSPLLQGLHIGLFVALAALVVYWILLNRTTLGYEVRAVGFNPDAAAYGGISVRRNYFLAMAISGGFAGLAGGIDTLGWLHTVDETLIQSYSYVAFLGIAVALLGRNTAVGIFFAALLFAALTTGTSTRNLDPEVFKPELAGNLTEMIQGLVVLFVGAELLVLGIWNARRKLRAPGKKAGAA
jgi:general nucleoside transport system permease protein